MTPPLPQFASPLWADGIPDVAPATRSYVHVIGDIGVTRSLVVTPNGTCAVRETVWAIADHTEVRRAVPRWAKFTAAALAVVGGLGLLFLLVRKTTTDGYLEVSVSGGAITYCVPIQVRHSDNIAAIRHAVHEIQLMVTLAAGSSSSRSGFQQCREKTTSDLPGPTP